jgi:WD40 repeat protein
MKHEKSVWGAVFNASQERILTWSEDGTARLWSRGNQALIAVFRHRGPVSEAMFDATEQRVLTTSDDGTSRLWDVSMNPSIPVEEHMLEFEVRSATTLDAGVVRVLSQDEWAGKRGQWEAAVQARKAGKR